MAKNSKQYSYSILVDIVTKGGAELAGLLQGAIKAGSTLTKNINSVLADGASEWTQTLTDVVNRSLSDQGLNNKVKDSLNRIQKNINDTKLTLITSDTVQDAKDKINKLKEDIKDLQKQQEQFQSTKWAEVTYNRKGPKGKNESNKVGIEYLQQKFDAAIKNSSILQQGGYKREDLTNMEKALEIAKALSAESITRTKAEKDLYKAINNQKDALDKQVQIKDAAKASNEVIGAKEQEIKSIEQQIKEYEENADAYDKYATWLAGVTAYITQLKNGNPIALPKPPGEEKDLADDVKSGTQADIDNRMKANKEAADSAEQLTQALGQQYISFQAVKRAMMEVYNVTKQLDTAFNEIAVVSTYSTKEV